MIGKVSWHKVIQEPSSDWMICSTDGFESGEKSLVRAVCSSPSVSARDFGLSEKNDENSFQPFVLQVDTW